ncbi:hypothetical protein AJ80_00136 [Polytolypa hystricis UAMH7299]|uniref:Flavoprotein oxygenase n=1 Tax=Polytolypa hystricis (strain UAMH7299) TaxID=1447883 RepID=A0A2B7Z3S3_POLH7|nr:hypothetical protein AJ80_00136 [Polytolypa hystricis UAMH7299]
MHDHEISSHDPLDEHGPREPPSSAAIEQEDSFIFDQERALPETDISAFGNDQSAHIVDDEHGSIDLQNCEHHSSSSSSSRHSGGFTDEQDDYYDEDGMLIRRPGSPSSHSSISSLPGSVVVYPRGKSSTLTPSSQFHHGHFAHYAARYDGEMSAHGSGGKRKTGTYKAVPHVRDRDSPFRHPSSVRAMQMGDESYDDEEPFTPKSRRHARYSGVSMRSLMSSPGLVSKQSDRSPHESNKSPPVQEKEYPLVLLHCTVLPPSLSLPQGSVAPTPELLKEVLPEKYWKRWKLLEDKIVGSGLLRDRGLLISHPQEMYDVLEERLMESLELVRPRLSHGHFLGGDGDDDSRQSSEDEGSEHDEEHESNNKHGHKCPDCGGKVVQGLHSEERKWDVRVYAANGLMKAGAWAAAWREMEKVDVEVGVWLPADIRRELERRIIEQDAVKVEEERQLAEEKKRRVEVYGDTSCSPTAQDEFSGLERGDEFPFPQSFEQMPRAPSPPFAKPSREVSHSHSQKGPTAEVDLQTLLANYIRVLASDTRNVALAFLSILVLYLAVGLGGKTAPLPAVAITPIASAAPEVHSLQFSPTAATAAASIYQYAPPPPPIVVASSSLSVESPAVYSTVTSSQLAAPPPVESVAAVYPEPEKQVASSVTDSPEQQATSSVSESPEAEVETSSSYVSASQPTASQAPVHPGPAKDLPPVIESSVEVPRSSPSALPEEALLDVEDDDASERAEDVPSGIESSLDLPSSFPSTLPEEILSDNNDDDDTSEPELQLEVFSEIEEPPTDSKPQQE